MGSIAANGNKLAEARLGRTQPGIFSVDDLADVGVDLGTPVADYGASSRFDGSIDEVTITVSGPIFSSPEVYLGRHPFEFLISADGARAVYRSDAATQPPEEGRGGVAVQDRPGRSERLGAAGAFSRGRRRAAPSRDMGTGQPCNPRQHRHPRPRYALAPSIHGASMRQITLLAFLFCTASISAADGNVEVSINAEGDLVVIGDAQANGIILWGYKGPPEEVRAEPGTTINGGPGPFVLPDLRGRILVDLGPGDDRLDSTMGFPAGSVLHMGAGADRVVLGDTSGYLRVDLGAGDDTLDVQDSGFRRLFVEAGPGNDLVMLFFAGGDTFSARMDEGNDLLSLKHGYFHGPVSLSGGAGTDEFEQLDNLFGGGPPKVVGFESRSRP